jgi:hypothetical protein
MALLTFDQGTHLQWMGAVLDDKDGPLLVMEFMEFGSLYDLLHNESVVLEGEVLLPILGDVAQGMRYEAPHTCLPTPASPHTKHIFQQRLLMQFEACCDLFHDDSASFTLVPKTGLAALCHTHTHTF